MEGSLRGGVGVPVTHPCRAHQEGELREDHLEVEVHAHLGRQGRTQVGRGRGSKVGAQKIRWWR